METFFDMTMSNKFPLNPSSLSICLMLTLLFLLYDDILVFLFGLRFFVCRRSISPVRLPIPHPTHTHRNTAATNIEKEKSVKESEKKSRAR